MYKVWRFQTVQPSFLETFASLLFPPYRYRLKSRFIVNEIKVHILDISLTLRSYTC